MTRFNSPALFVFAGLLAAALCLAGCATEKQYSGDAAGKAPAVAAPSASAAPADNSRAKPGSDEAGGK